MRNVEQSRESGGNLRDMRLEHLEVGGREISNLGLTCRQEKRDGNESGASLAWLALNAPPISIGYINLALRIHKVQQFVHPRSYVPPIDNFRMTNAWYNPHHQQDIPSTPDNPSAAGPGQITAEPNVDNTIPGCPCPICSRARYNYQTNQRTTEYQDPSAPVESIVPYAYQNFGGGYPYDIAATVGGQPPAWPVAPQAPENQENAGYAPLQEAVTSSSFEIETGAAPDQAQVLDMSIPERLRRLAGRYVNDPESLVNGVHLEPGPSGRFQIVITIEIGDVLGDTIS
ncbi:hypothetical protein F5888DRAFT_539083 [Russula emetica]|nr:hypothetical protein F5888DRAFT_539083 [Russula emetica]